ncbi:MAG: hypothetical protein CVU80_01310 [Elusimicrobia bacterium HGW-Elusimicrobia-4]|nr:MAG: hypothetical protein CVU80_01310 [Elusimicrobia bacterium HGW-Elusimicrobia-4]
MAKTRQSWGSKIGIILAVAGSIVFCRNFSLAIIKGADMTLSGWIFLSVSWLFIILLIFFCATKILKGEKND